MKILRRAALAAATLALLAVALPAPSGAFSPPVPLQCGSYDELPGTVTTNPGGAPALHATLQFISCSGVDIVGSASPPLLGVAKFDLSLATMPTVLNRPFAAEWDGTRPAGYLPVVTRLSMQVKDYRNGLLQPPVVFPVRAYVTAELEDVGVIGSGQPHAIVLRLDGVTDGRYLPGRHVTGRFTFDEAALTTGSGDIFVNGTFVNGLSIRNEPAPTVQDNGPIHCSSGAPKPPTWRYRFAPAATAQDQRATLGAPLHAGCTDDLGLGVQSLTVLRASLRAHEDDDPTADLAGESPLAGTATLVLDDDNAVTPVQRSVATVSAFYVQGSAGGPVTYRLAGLIRKGPATGAWIDSEVTVDLGACVSAPLATSCPVNPVSIPIVGFPFDIASSGGA